MAYEVRLSKRASDNIARLSVVTQQQVISIIGRLNENPRPIGVKKLAGYREMYRLPYRKAA